MEPSQLTVKNIIGFPEGVTPLPSRSPVELHGLAGDFLFVAPRSDLEGAYTTTYSGVFKNDHNMLYPSNRQHTTTASGVKKMTYDTMGANQG